LARSFTGSFLRTASIRARREDDNA
jgi:hypothetical protein